MIRVNRDLWRSSVWKMIEYQCPSCGRRYELLEGERQGPDERVGFVNCVRCWSQCERVVSAPKIRKLTGPQSVTFTRGKPEEPEPGDFSTRHLAKD